MHLLPVYISSAEKKHRKREIIFWDGPGRSHDRHILRAPGTSREVDAISAFYPEKTIKKKVDISEDFFKQQAKKFNIIHLATHAYFNKEQPLFSYLLLHPTENNDGQLTVHEVFGLDLRARLVVLSACQTGLGDISRGDELVGLSRAFIYAGTPSVIVSLWSLADEPAAQLMIQFHRHLKTKPAPEALALAQREMIKENKSPYYWAPFVLVGTEGTAPVMALSF